MRIHLRARRDGLAPPGARYHSGHKKCRSGSQNRKGVGLKQHRAYGKNNGKNAN
jgi:hypothetical protein